VLVSRHHVGGGELDVDPHTELADGRLDLRLHLLLALADDGGLAELGHVWWWLHSIFLPVLLAYRVSGRM